MSDEEGASVLKRLSMNTKLSSAKIFEDDSSEEESKQGGGKQKKSSKKNVKKSPYKVNITKSKIEHEKDPEVLERRQKQIDYGKNTVGYDNYRQLIPIKKRLPEHPRTPVKNFKYSRRGWDGLIRNWRQKLHQFDPDGDKKCANDIDINEDETSEKSNLNFLEFV